MNKKKRYLLTHALLVVVAVLTLCSCAPPQLIKTPRYFWPPVAGEEKVEYLRFYFSDEDLMRGVDRRLETAILGKRNPERLVNQPTTVASDGKGRIFVGDVTHNAVLVLDRTAHTFRFFGKMQGPAKKVLVDQRGEIWVLEATQMKIYHFAADEKLIGEVKITGLERVVSLAVDSERQRLYLSDTPNHRICVFDYQGTMLQSFGKRGKGPGEFNYPTDLDLDVNGNLYVLDTMNARVEVLSPEGVYLRSFGERGTASGAFAIAKGIAVSPAGLVYVTDATQNKIVIFNTNGDFLMSMGGLEIFDGKIVHPGGFYSPAGIDVDANETIFVADLFNGLIHEFQYLTPAYLALHPILAGESYQPKGVDLKGGALKGGDLKGGALKDGAQGADGEEITPSR